MVKARPPIERLLERVVEQESGCWLWTGAPDSHGYSQIMVGSRVDGSRRLMRGHVVSYEHFVGPVPEGLELNHLCRNRLCVNPDHLEPVTRRVNTLRGNSPAAKHAKKKRCPKGHPYKGKNLRITKQGQRVCVTCRREKGREAYWADPEKYRARKRVQ